MTDTCPFCTPNLKRDQIALENQYCLFLQRSEPVLVGSGLIVPKAHRQTLFDLTQAEIVATFDLLDQAKRLIDESHSPSGYNVGWNCGTVAGQEIFHAHLHVIPRFEDEPHAGKGIRYWLKQEDNRRLNNALDQPRRLRRENET